MASFSYSSCLEDALAGRVNFATDIFAVMLVGASYKADRSADSKRSVALAAEIKGEGYEARGATVAVALRRDGNVVSIELGGAIWKDATITARAAVYYKRRNGDAASEELVAYVDFGRDVTSTNDAFTLTASTIRIPN